MSDVRLQLVLADAYGYQTGNGDIFHDRCNHADRCLHDSRCPMRSNVNDTDVFVSDAVDGTGILVRANEMLCTCVL